jgi:hypothetical protein
MTALVFLVSFAFYLAGASPAIGARDCADMASAALTVGVAHPPGYPLYSVLGHLWLTIFPLGNPAYGLAVLSCLAGAGACAFIFLAVRRRSGVEAGLCSAGIVLFSAPLWKFALLQEKYSLHACFIAALIWLSHGDDSSVNRRARLTCFLTGLGLVNHQSLLLFLPGLYLLWGARRRALAASVPWLFAGLSLYAFLWIRLGSLGEALSVALRSQYGSGTLSASLARPFTPDGAVVLFAWSLKAWALAVGLPVTAAAVFGLCRCENRVRAAGLVVGALASGPLFVLLARFDPSNWVARSALEPAFLVPALVAAILAGEAVARAGRAAPAAALALAASALLLRSPIPERRDDFLAHDYVRNLRRAVPPGSSLLAAGDTALFGLRWLELVEPRAPSREVSGAGLVDPRTWLAARVGREDIYATGLVPGVLPPAALAPQGLVQKIGAAGVAAPLILRRSKSWLRDDSYARDAKLSYAFAAWSAARLLEAQGRTAPESLDLSAVVLDPEDYHLD